MRRVDVAVLVIVAILWSAVSCIAQTLEVIALTDRDGFQYLGTPFIDEEDRMVFYARTDEMTPREGIWATTQDGSPFPIAQLGDATPEGTEFTIFFGLFPSINSGHVAFRAMAWSEGTGWYGGIYVYRDSILELVAKDGDMAPGHSGNEAPFSGLYSNQRVLLSREGDVAFTAILDESQPQRTGVWVWRDGTLELVYLEGDWDPDIGGVLMWPEGIDMNADGTVAVRGKVDLGEEEGEFSGLWIRRVEEDTVAMHYEPAVGLFAGPFITSNENIGYCHRVRTYSGSTCVYQQEDLTDLANGVIAAGGAGAPGTSCMEFWYGQPACATVMEYPRCPVLNNQDQSFFFQMLEDNDFSCPTPPPVQPETGFWYKDVNQIVAIALEHQASWGGPTGEKFALGFATNPIAMSDGGHVAFLTQVTGGFWVLFAADGPTAGYRIAAVGETLNVGAENREVYDISFGGPEQGLVRDNIESGYGTINACGRLVFRAWMFENNVGSYGVFRVRLPFAPCE